MSTAHKKTALRRTCRGGVANREISGCASPNEYSNREPVATIYDRRRLIGLLVDEPRQCAALTVDRFLIGVFPDRKAATLAIINRGPAT